MAIGFIFKHNINGVCILNVEAGMDAFMQRSFRCKIRTK